MHDFDLLVIGGGHAGIEAATAARRLGTSVCLVTFSRDNIGELSCNPSIGGIGKGIITLEIDALNGVMPQVIDKSSIHSKILNSSRGAAVHGPRAQADRKLYKREMLKIIENYGLHVLYGEVIDIIIDDSRVRGCIVKDLNTNDEYTLLCKSAVITTGTFLGGKIYIGDERLAGGRLNEDSSNRLCDRIQSLGIKFGRMKTGTPPRIYRNSLRWDSFEEQIGDVIPAPFSFMTKSIDTPQISCHIGYTNSVTHDIIRNNIHTSAMYSGAIESSGPRYCPSIEDKIVRFADKESHRVFLELEGLDSDLIYPNGLSTSLSRETQTAMVRSIYGMENAEIAQYGYAIEYTYIDPRELNHQLALRAIPNLFLAGQINGTTGYEEAAGQGLVAGVNAGLYALNCDSGSECGERYRPFILTRNQSYIGVMIDDLLRNGATEPYRMMTSRAEYRTYLRPDNSRQRLTAIGREFGIVANDYWEKHREFEDKREIVWKFGNNIRLSHKIINESGIGSVQDGQTKTIYELLGLQNISQEKVFDLLNKMLECGDYRNINREEREIWGNIESDEKKKILNLMSIDSMYCNYNRRLIKDIDLLEEYRVIPSDIDYSEIKMLSNEVRDKLNLYKPINIQDARKIEGITPSAIVALQLYIRGMKKIY